jgi:hypothetical protein
MKHTSLVATAPIAPIFKADAVTLHVSREKDGKLRIVYDGWDDFKVRSGNEALEPTGKLAEGERAYYRQGKR